MKIVIASSNLNKIREFRRFLKKLEGLDVLSLMDFPRYIPEEETGTTFEENARKKALHAAKELGVYALADDSGLVVPALNGEPGLYSARYAFDGASDKDNRMKLIEKVKRLPEEARQAYFECWLALASPEGEIKVVKGICEGRVTTEERGNRGFGYDPMFIKYDYSKTFGELDEEMKNEVSHRGKAFDKMRPFIENLVALSSK